MNYSGSIKPEMLRLKMLYRLELVVNNEPVSVSYGSRIEVWNLLLENRPHVDGHTLSVASEEESQSYLICLESDLAEAKLYRKPQPGKLLGLEQKVMRVSRLIAAGRETNMEVE